MDLKIKLANVTEWKLESALNLHTQRFGTLSPEEHLAWGVPPSILLLQ